MHQASQQQADLELPPEEHPPQRVHRNVLVLSLIHI